MSATQACVVPTEVEKAWIRLSSNLEQLEKFLEDAPAEIERRRADGDDPTWLVEAVAELGTILPGLRQLAAAHRIVETLQGQPQGKGLQLDELAAETGLSAGRLTDVLRQLERDGLLGPGPHSIS